MKFLKKWPLASAFGLIVIALTSVFAATYVQRFTVGGTEVWRIDNDGSVDTPSSITLGGPLKFGSEEVATAATLPTTTTGSNFGDWVPVYNVGAAVIQGQLLISSNTGTAFVAGGPATQDLTNIVGVAAEAIASGAKGWMVPRGGGYAVILGSGTIAIGDILVSSAAAAGYGWSDNTPTAGASIGRAMSTNTSGSGNPILAIME